MCGEDRKLTVLQARKRRGMRFALESGLKGQREFATDMDMSQSNGAAVYKHLKEEGYVVGAKVIAHTEAARRFEAHQHLSTSTTADTLLNPFIGITQARLRSIWQATIRCSHGTRDSKKDAGESVRPDDAHRSSRR